MTQGTLVPTPEIAGDVDRLTPDARLGYAQQMRRVVLVAVLAGVVAAEVCSSDPSRGWVSLLVVVALAAVMVLVFGSLAWFVWSRRYLRSSSPIEANRMIFAYPSTKRKKLRRDMLAGRASSDPVERFAQIGVADQEARNGRQLGWFAPVMIAMLLFEVWNSNDGTSWFIGVLTVVYATGIGRQLRRSRQASRFLESMRIESK